MFIHDIDQGAPDISDVSTDVNVAEAENLDDVEREMLNDNRTSHPSE